MIEVKGFDGHLILYCKSHYKHPLGYLEGFKMIWCIRCGLIYEKDNNTIYRYIANKLYSLIKQLIPERIEYLQEVIHEEITNDWRYNNATAIERLIYIYASEIADIQIKNKIADKKWNTLIKLPKPNKRVFNRILRGNGRYNDYWVIEPKTN